MLVSLDAAKAFDNVSCSTKNQLIASKHFIKTARIKINRNLTNWFKLERFTRHPPPSLQSSLSL